MNRWVVALFVGTLLGSAMPMSAADRYVAQGGQVPVSPYTNGWGSAASNIQDAINVAFTNDTVWVRDGRYTVPPNGVAVNGVTNVVYVDRPLTIRSVSGMPESVLLDGRGRNRGINVHYNSSTTNRFILIGLTVSNSLDRGIWFSATASGVAWTGVIEHCLVTHGASGEGIYDNHSSIGRSYLISDTVVRANPADGITLYSSLSNATFSSRFTRCVVEGNAGSGCSFQNGTHVLERCTIRDNTAPSSAGGLRIGVGIYTLDNCLISGNVAAGIGGALYKYSAAGALFINNCTIVSNRSTVTGPGGIRSAAPNPVVNSIVRYNYLNGSVSDVFAAGTRFTNSCIASIGIHTNAGNITDDPRFVDMAGLNFRLLSNSPCINAGTNQAGMSDAVDLDGFPRMDDVSRRVDMGCYEYALHYLVQTGQPCADIVVATNPTRMAAYAARELQTYLARITGATLPIVTPTNSTAMAHVYVGRSDATDRLGLSNDGLLHGAFRMVSGVNWLALLGRDADYAPHEPYATNSADVARVMAEWDALTGETWDNPTTANYNRYAPLLGIHQWDECGSLNAVHEYLRSLGVRWFMPGELGEVVPSLQTLVVPEINALVEPDYAYRNIYFYLYSFRECRTGGLTTTNELQWQLRLGVQSIQDALGWAKAHGTGPVHSRSEVQSTHPEYYALWDGVRQTNYIGSGAPCLSLTGGLLTQNVAYARALFDIYDAPMVGVGPCDAYVKVCECPLCVGKATPERGTHGAHSDYVWAYANRVAESVYATHPDRKISCPAYGYYRLAPTNISMMSSNLVIGWCQWRSEYGDEAAWTSYTNEIATWMSKLPSKQMYKYDYYLHSEPWRGYAGIPVYFPHAIARDLSFTKGKSFGEYCTVYRNKTTNSWDSLAANHLNVYVTSRLYWDADQDVDALLDDYYQKFYGPAAVPMKAYVDYCETNWPSMQTNKTAIDTMFALLDEARQAAGSGIYSQRVDLLVKYCEQLEPVRAALSDHYVAQNGQTPQFPYTNWVMAASNIQDAVDASSNNVTVWVGAGRYTKPANAVVYGGSTNVVYLNKLLTLRSSNGVASSTVIDGGGLYRGIAVACAFASSDRFVLDGITVSNGYSSAGSAIYIKDGYSWTGVVQNCAIANSRDGVGGLGALCVHNTTLEPNVIVVTNCLFRGNQPAGLYARPGVSGGMLVSQCQFEKNNGVGLSLYGGTNLVDQCVFVANSNSGNYGSALQVWGGGRHVARNCLVHSNYLGGTFGGTIGVSGSSIDIHNCTLVNNRQAPVLGGAVYSHSQSPVRMWSTIAYFNWRTNGAVANYGGNAGTGGFSMTNCCVYPAFAGANNFTNDPRFVDAAGQDYHLAGDSPCVDTGTNQAWMAEALDLDGRPRIDPLAGVVDRGCYENAAGGERGMSMSSSGALLQGLDPLSDLDGDGICNADEIRTGTNPCDVRSALRILAIDRDGQGNMRLALHLGSNGTYHVLAGGAPGGIQSSCASIVTVSEGLYYWSDTNNSDRPMGFYSVSGGLGK